VDCSAYEAQDLAIVEVAELPPRNKAERERQAVPRYDGSQT
jgi:hypothetical protein